MIFLPFLLMILSHSVVGAYEPIEPTGEVSDSLRAGNGDMSELQKLESDLEGLIQPRFSNFKKRFPHEIEIYLLKSYFAGDEKMLLEIAYVSKSFCTYSRYILAAIYPQRMIYQARIAHEVVKNGSFFYYQRHEGEPSLEEDETKELEEGVDRDNSIGPKVTKLFIPMLLLAKKIHPNG